MIDELIKVRIELSDSIEAFRAEDFLLETFHSVQAFLKGKIVRKKGLYSTFFLIRI